MPKRAITYETNSPRKKVSKQQSPEKPNLHTIISNIKDRKNHLSTLKLVKKYAQNDNRINEYSLQTLLLRFLREIKHAFESLNENENNIVKNENVILINNIRLICQTMQELSIDKTMILSNKDRFFKILASDEYLNYIIKKRMPSGIEIELSAMVIMDIAYNKLINIQNKYHLIDIFNDLDSYTNSPSTKMSSKSIIKQSAGYNDDNSKYYKFTTKVINNVSKNIYKVRGEPQQYVKDKHKYYILKEYRNMVNKSKKSKKY
jgi:hypothetical protein